MVARLKNIVLELRDTTGDRRFEDTAILYRGAVAFRAIVGAQVISTRRGERAKGLIHRVDGRSNNKKPAARAS